VKRHGTTVLTAAGVVPLAVRAAGRVASRRDGCDGCLVARPGRGGRGNIGLQLAALLAAVSSGVGSNFLMARPFDNLTVGDGTDLKARPRWC
jgi:hypothetical protein